MKKLGTIEIIVFLASILVFGKISGDYHKGWAVEATYLLVSLYPMYVVRKNKALFRPMIGAFFCYLFGIAVHGSEEAFTYSVVAYGFLGIYNVRYDTYETALVCLAIIIFAPLHEIIRPEGALVYVSQALWHFMYSLLLFLPILKMVKEEEIDISRTLTTSRKIGV